MLAPVSGPPTMASNATVRPTASPATGPATRASVATAMITSMRKSDSTSSMMSDGAVASAGVVTLAIAADPTVSRSSAAAAAAPTSCATTYGATSAPGNRRALQNPIVTAGFRWAPEMCPSEYTAASTTKPKDSATPRCVTCPPDHRSTAAAPGPMVTNMNVPTASAAARRAIMPRACGRARTRPSPCHPLLGPTLRCPDRRRRETHAHRRTRKPVSARSTGFRSRPRAAVRGTHSR